MDEQTLLNGGLQLDYYPQGADHDPTTCLKHSVVSPQENVVCATLGSKKLSYIQIKPLRARCYQHILGVMSDRRPKTRESIHMQTGLRMSTVCGRVNELLKYGVLEVCGYKKASSGRNVELIKVI